MLTYKVPFDVTHDLSAGSEFHFRTLLAFFNTTANSVGLDVYVEGRLTNVLIPPSTRVVITGEELLRRVKLSDRTGVIAWFIGNGDVGVVNLTLRYNPVTGCLLETYKETRC